MRCNRSIPGRLPPRHIFLREMFRNRLSFCVSFIVRGSAKNKYLCLFVSRFIFGRNLEVIKISKMSCFSFNSTTKVIVSKQVDEIITEKLNLLVEIIPNTSYVCIMTIEGMLLAHATRKEVPTADILCNISALKPSVNKLLKFYRIDGSSIIHLSGNISTISVYSIKENTYLVVSHQCDLKKSFVVDFEGMDATVHPFVEELSGFFNNVEI